MTKAVHLLLSAHDTAAARSLIEVARAAEADPGVQVSLCADGPAAPVARGAGIAFREVAVPRVSAGDAPGLDALTEAGARILAEMRPDAIVTGLSGPDAGLDEALIAAAAGRYPCFSLQDYWGDVNPVARTWPDAFLVADDFAAHLTTQRTGRRAIVVGLPRYAGLAAPPTRTAARALLSLNAATRALCWFGQPLHAAPGYRDTLSAFAEAVAELDGPVRLYFRSHPREDPKSHAETCALLEASGQTVHSANDAPLEVLLAGLDVAVSAFSTVVVDLAYLQRKSRAPLASGLYVANEMLSAFHLDYSGLPEDPLVSAGMALERQQGETLAQTLCRAARVDTRTALHRAAWALSDPAAAGAAVVSAVLDNVEAARRGA